MDGETVVLKAQKDDRSFHLIKGKGVHKFFKQGIKGITGHLFMLIPAPTTTIACPQLQHLLEEYEDVFVEPQQLPMHRNLDHKIPLKPNSKPFNLRPYRYPYFQKTKVEKLVREMLNA